MYYDTDDNRTPCVILTSLKVSSNEPRSRWRRCSWWSCPEFLLQTMKLCPSFGRLARVLDCRRSKCWLARSEPTICRTLQMIQFIAWHKLLLADLIVWTLCLFFDLQMMDIYSIILNRRRWNVVPRLVVCRELWIADDLTFGPILPKIHSLLVTNFYFLFVLETFLLQTIYISADYLQTINASFKIAADRIVYLFLESYWMTSKSMFGWLIELLGLLDCRRSNLFCLLAMSCGLQTAT